MFPRFIGRHKKKQESGVTHQKFLYYRCSQKNNEIRFCVCVLEREREKGANGTVRLKDIRVCITCKVILANVFVIPSQSDGHHKLKIVWTNKFKHNDHGSAGSKKTEREMLKKRKHQSI